MKKKVFALLIAFMCIFSMRAAVVFASADVIPNDETGIPDKVLYQEILKALDELDILDMKERETFTKQEAARIDWLDARLTGIKNLKGIGCLVNLRGLNLVGIECIDGIEELQNLTSLDLSYTRLKNWEPLSKLQTLECLDINGCSLTDLKGTGIENLTNLKDLSAYENKLKNIDGIKNLKKLEKLYLWENQLANTKALKGLDNLKELHLSDNGLKNAKELKNLKKLEKLSIGDNQLKTLPNLKKLSRLKELYLEGNYLPEKELGSKLPAKILKDKNWKKDAAVFQKCNAAIKLKSPSHVKRITKNTGKISGSVSAVPGYQKELYVRLYNPESSKYRAKRWKVNADGSFEISGLNLKKWAGDTVSLEVMAYRESVEDWKAVNSIKFKVKK